MRTAFSWVHPCFLNKLRKQRKNEIKKQTNFNMHIISLQSLGKRLIISCCMFCLYSIGGTWSARGNSQRSMDGTEWTCWFPGKCKNEGMDSQVSSYYERIGQYRILFMGGDLSRRKYWVTCLDLKVHMAMFHSNDASLALGASTIEFPERKYSLPWYLKHYLLKSIDMFWSKVMFVWLQMSDQFHPWHIQSR